MLRIVPNSVKKEMQCMVGVKPPRSWASSSAGTDWLDPVYNQGSAAPKATSAALRGEAFT